uniref:hypothetical protein n=1 Tax=Yersinia pestis TaxID=632 RepID=UPI001300BB12
PLKKPGVLKTGGFPLLGEKRAQKKFFPGEKIFPGEKNFGGFKKTPKKRGPFFKKTPGVFKKTPGFFPFWGKKRGPKKKFFPPGKKNFSPGGKKNFLGVF